MKKIKSFSLVSFTNHALVSFCAEVESHVKASLPVENSVAASQLQDEVEIQIPASVA